MQYIALHWASFASFCGLLCKCGILQSSRWANCMHLHCPMHLHLATYSHLPILADGDCNNYSHIKSPVSFSFIVIIVKKIYVVSGVPGDVFGVHPQCDHDQTKFLRKDRLPMMWWCSVESSCKCWLLLLLLFSICWHHFDTDKDDEESGGAIRASC